MEKQKYHVHIYEVNKKAEINIIAENATEAKEIALRFKDNLSYHGSDCKHIALDFQLK